MSASPIWNETLLAIIRHGFGIMCTILLITGAVLAIRRTKPFIAYAMIAGLLLSLISQVGFLLIIPPINAFDVPIGEIGNYVRSISYFGQIGSLVMGIAFICFVRSLPFRRETEHPMHPSHAMDDTRSG